MAGYSGTPLVRKLGIRPNEKFIALNAPENYAQLARRFAGRRDDNESPNEWYASSSICSLGNEAIWKSGCASLRTKLDDAGMLWISWPKKSSKVATDITEDTIRAVALAARFVDVKVCAVDEIWSGLKLMIRRENQENKMKTRYFDHIDLRVKDRETSAEVLRTGSAGDRFHARKKRAGMGDAFTPPGEGKLPFFGFTEDPNHRPNGTRISFWADTREEVDRVAEVVRRAGGKVLEGPELCANTRRIITRSFSRIRTATSWRFVAGTMSEIDARARPAFHPSAGRRRWCRSRGFRAIISAPSPCAA